MRISTSKIATSMSPSRSEGNGTLGCQIESLRSLAERFCYFNTPTDKSGP